MNFLYILPIFGIFVVALATKCHVADDDSELHCGDATNMTCSGDYTPFCHKIWGDHSTQNGECTCELFCLTDSDCTGGCGSISFLTSGCVESYTGAIEKVCLCKFNRPGK